MAGPPRHRRLRVGAAAVAMALVCVGSAVAFAQKRPGGATLEGRVEVTRAGEREANASGVVVYLVGFEERAPKGEAELIQEGLSFFPDVLPITLGQQVSFPNRDHQITHNVFSHRPRFNLGQFRAGRGRPPSRRFDKLGPVELYCNIHPEMVATILVLPNRRHATTAVDGSFRLEGVPPGTWTLFAYDRRALAPVSTKVALAEGGTTTLSLSVERDRPETRGHKRADGSEYPAGAYR